MKIEHIALYVRDLETAKNFFTTYFDCIANNGYHNKITEFRSYFLTFDNGARLELMTRPNLKDSDQDPDCLGYAHIAFSVGSKEKVDQITQQLMSDGYPVLSGPRTTGDGYYESCIIGFEGNIVEITV